MSADVRLGSRLPTLFDPHPDVQPARFESAKRSGLLPAALENAAKVGFQKEVNAAFCPKFGFCRAGVGLPVGR